MKRTFNFRTGNGASSAEWDRYIRFRAGATVESDAPAYQIARAAARRLESSLAVAHDTAPDVVKRLIHPAAVFHEKRGNIFLDHLRSPRRDSNYLLPSYDE